MMREGSVYIAGEWKEAPRRLPVNFPLNGKQIAISGQADEIFLEEAVVKNARALTKTARTSTQVRYESLMHISNRLLELRKEFAQVICLEAGKPIRLAEAEVDRAIQTFSLAADVVRTQHGEVVPLDLISGMEKRMGIVRRFPVGPVLAIAPFNFPLNLVAHKVAPAIAAGCPVLLKPASKTPLTSILLAELISETSYPAEGFSVVPCDRVLGQKLVEDPRFNLLSFTGSPEVGWAMKASAGRKKVVLELGGDAAAIIDSSADLRDAASKCAMGAFAYAGQVCISIQRIIIHTDVYHEFMNHFMAAVAALGKGDPQLPGVVVGPVIDEHNANRIEQWVDEARKTGAYLHTGAFSRDGNEISPVVLENVQRNCKLVTQEAFAPVVLIYKCIDFRQAVDVVNGSRFGLQASIFTDSQSQIRYAYDHIEAGAVIVNHAPSVRVDNMPYGGVKDSGIGREGIAYAMQDYTEPRMLFW